jgi:putative transposase
MEFAALLLYNYAKPENEHKPMTLTHYTYRFRLRPNKDQKNRLARHFGVCRLVYNYFLDLRNRLYRENKQGSSYHKDCVELKKELDWIGEANSQSLQQELKTLDTVFNRFFKKQAKFPKFHSKKTDKQSFRIPQFVSVKDGNLHFPKFREGIKVKLHREIEGEIKYATVSMNRAGQFFISVCVVKNIVPLVKVEKEVGIDLGVKDLATVRCLRTSSRIARWRSD